MSWFIYRFMTCVINVIINRLYNHLCYLHIHFPIFPINTPSFLLHVKH